MILQSDVLVLNRHFQPIQLTSVRRAVTQLYEGVARAVDAEYRTFDFESWIELSARAAAGECIRTPRLRLLVPRVITLVTYELMPRTRVRFSRMNIFARDASTCQYCGRRLPRTELNLDHVVPRSRGGSTSWENVVCSCVPCNLHKGGRTPQEAAMRLLRLPARPRWTPLLRAPLRKATYREWQPFLSLADASYWNVELLDD